MTQLYRYQSSNQASSLERKKLSHLKRKLLQASHLELCAITPSHHQDLTSQGHHILNQLDILSKQFNGAFYKDITECKRKIGSINGKMYELTNMLLEWRRLGHSAHEVVFNPWYVELTDHDEWCEHMVQEEAKNDRVLEEMMVARELKQAQAATRYIIGTHRLIGTYSH